MPALAPFLVAGLQNFEAYHVCAIAVGLVGDIARSIEGKILPFCNDIMTALVQSLRDENLHRSVKPTVLSCFGDIAMALAAAFEPYLPLSMMMLMQASTTAVPDDDEELVEFANELRGCIVEAYTGIIQAFRDGGRVNLMSVYIDPIMQFLQSLGAEEIKDYDVLGKAAGLVG
jgi:importin subunit beta-1